MRRHSLLIWTTLSLGLHLALLLTLPARGPVRSGDSPIVVKLRAPGRGDPQSRPPLSPDAETRPTASPAAPRVETPAIDEAPRPALPMDVPEELRRVRAETPPPKERQAPSPKAPAGRPESPGTVAPPGLAEKPSVKEEARARASEDAPPRLATEGESPPASTSEPSAPLPSAGARPNSTEASPRYDLNPPPPYPRSALRRRWEGTAMIRVKVTADGLVREAALQRSSGYPVLDRSALEAVRAWRFHPATRNEEPVEAEVVVPLVFKISRGR